MLDTVKLYIAAAIAVLFIVAGGYGWWEYHRAETLQTANDGLVKELATSVTVANHNEALRAQEAARAARAEDILASNATAAVTRGDTLTTIAREIEHAKPAPVGCPVVPDSIRAVARVLRERPASAVPGH